MTSPYIYGGLSRAINDPTTIDQAISIAVQAHDDEPTAHLEAGQSLTTHRAAQIIDHLAESVVNDKLASIARSYVAIVGSGLAGDYSTIESAVTYAKTVGGGTILLTPGHYYLSGIVNLPLSINIEGTDLDAVFVHGDKTTLKYLHIIPDTITNQTQQRFKNITFQNDGGGIFWLPSAEYLGTSSILFDFCKFKGGGPYYTLCTGNLYVTDCTFELNANIAVQGTGNVWYTRVTCTKYLTSSTCIFHSSDSINSDICAVFVDSCQFKCNGAINANYLNDDGIENIDILRSTFYDWNTATFTSGARIFMSNIVYLKPATAFTIPWGVSGILIIGNKFYNGAVPNITVAGDNCVITGNVSNGAITNTGAGNIIANNTPEMPYKVALSADIAIEFALRDTVKLTPNTTRTLTTTVPHAGESRTLIILTSGITSYILTFGTGFKTISTLTTGTVSARYFIIRFVSDGVSLIETSRTTAIA